MDVLFIPWSWNTDDNVEASFCGPDRGCMTYRMKEIHLMDTSILHAECSALNPLRDAVLFPCEFAGTQR